MLIRNRVITLSKNKALEELFELEWKAWEKDEDIAQGQRDRHCEEAIPSYGGGR